MKVDKKAKQSLDAMMNGYLMIAPMWLKLVVGIKHIFAGNDRDKLYKIISDLRGKSKLTVPREQIAWNPTVVTDKCNGCKVCYEFCPKSVYEIENKIPVVRFPEKCVFLCTGCLNKCPSGAISFPPRVDFKEYFEY